MTLPFGDHTPDRYCLPNAGKIDSIKRILRRFVYPVYNALIHSFLARRYSTADFQPDLWLWGQRGHDYERHRRRVARFMHIPGSRIMVAGCGTARDLESWVNFQPQRIVGVDLFSYERAWSLWKQRFGKIAPNVEVSFMQADLARLRGIPDASFDVVSSDAVFEHLKNLPEVLEEFHRILRVGGVLYAAFGPLWFGWGGDHVSGYDAPTSGYNHLILEGDAYQRYLEDLGEYIHSEHDGRTWIKHDLFSRLKPREYLEYLEMAGFERLFVSAIIDPNTCVCLKNSNLHERLLSQFDLLDIQVSGMSIIFQKNK